MKRFLTILFLIVGVAKNTYAQQNNKIIQGKLLDSLTNETLPYATVKLETQENKTSEIVLTDENGNFRLKSPSEGKVSLSFEYMGYQKK
jgi:siderophore synthetase component